MRVGEPTELSVVPKLLKSLYCTKCKWGAFSNYRLCSVVPKCVVHSVPLTINFMQLVGWK